MAQESTNKTKTVLTFQRGAIQIFENNITFGRQPTQKKMIIVRLKMIRKCLKERDQNP